MELISLCLWFGGKFVHLLVGSYVGGYCVEIPNMGGTQACVEAMTMLCETLGISDIKRFCDLVDEGVCVD